MLDRFVAAVRSFCTHDFSLFNFVGGNVPWTDQKTSGSTARHSQRCSYHSFGACLSVVAVHGSGSLRYTHKNERLAQHTMPPHGTNENSSLLGKNGDLSARKAFEGSDTEASK